MRRTTQRVARITHHCHVPCRFAFEGEDAAAESSASPLNVSLPHKKLSFGSVVPSPPTAPADEVNVIPSSLAEVNAPLLTASQAPIKPVVAPNAASITGAPSHAPSGDAVRVYLRVRPPTDAERIMGGARTLQAVSDTTVRFEAPEVRFTCWHRKVIRAGYNGALRRSTRCYIPGRRH